MAATKNYNPNLSGLGLPQPLVDAIRILYQTVNDAQSDGTSSTIAAIQDTHANRLVLYPASASPAGSIYVETDRNNVVYIDRDVSQTRAWIWLTGEMSGTLAARPADLGTNDTGFIYSASDALDYRWNGGSWVTIDTVRGSTNLVDANRLIKVSSIGKIAEASPTDDGTKVSFTEPILVDTVSQPATEQLSVRASSGNGSASLIVGASGGNGYEILTFGAKYIAGTGFVPLDTVAVQIVKTVGGLFAIRGATGLTPGSGTPIAFTTWLTIDPAVGNLNASVAFSVGGVPGVTQVGLPYMTGINVTTNGLGYVTSVTPIMASMSFTGGIKTT